MGIKFYGRSAFMYKLFGNVPHYMHAAFKNGYPQPHVQRQKKKTRTRTHTHTSHRQEAQNVIANLILSLSILLALSAEKKYKSIRAGERYFICYAVNFIAIG